MVPIVAQYDENAFTEAIFRLIGNPLLLRKQLGTHALGNWRQIRQIKYIQKMGKIINRTIITSDSLKRIGWIVYM